MRRGSALLATLGLALLLAPATAFAHAQLESSSPVRGAIVEREPAAVTFRFDESVEGNFGAVRVYDASGARVDEGDAFHPHGEGSRIGVHLKPELPEGSYTATYRVVSADGHVVSGGFVFSIGEQGRAPEETVAELIGESDSGPVTETAFGIARGLQYAATALAVGALAFLLLVWLPGVARVRTEEEEEWSHADRAFGRRLRSVLLVAAIVGALSAVAGLVLEGAEAAGVSGFEAMKWPIVSEMLGTRFGTVWGLTALAWVVFGLAVVIGWSGGRNCRPYLFALFLPLGLAVLEPALSGHASTQSPVALLFAMNAIHVATMAIWLGGLACLLFVVPRGTRELRPAHRSKLLATALSRFSSVALACVAAILVTGLIQAYVYVRHLDDLTQTGYGRAVLAKLVLLLVVIGIGAHNRRRSLPGLDRVAAGGEPPGRAGLLLRRALRAEVALLVVVLGVTAALASYAPPVTAQSGPFSGDARLGPTQLEMTVDPARVGSNTVHVYLFDAVTGAPFEKVKQIEVAASVPDKEIGPLSLRAQPSGPGHYTIPNAPLSVAADWRLRVTLRVSAFDQYETALEVPIR